MYRKVLALLMIIIAVIYIGYTFHDHTKEIYIEQPFAVFTPVTETPVQTTEAASYDFITFSSKHVLDIDAVLQLPDYPTGCELISLTMALSYITGENVDTEILIDDYLTMSSNDFINGFMGDPRREDGGGCFPPVIVKCANEYLEDCHISLAAVDATGITCQEIFDCIDNGLPVIMWTTMYMGEPQKQNHFIESDGISYQWYISEHCVLVRGYNQNDNVFIINDPLAGEVERDIDEFMGISDDIGNLAVIIK